MGNAFFYPDVASFHLRDVLVREMNQKSSLSHRFCCRRNCCRRSRCSSASLLLLRLLHSRAQAACRVESGCHLSMFGMVISVFISAGVDDPGRRTGFHAGKSPERLLTFC